MSQFSGNRVAFEFWSYINWTIIFHWLCCVLIFMLLDFFLKAQSSVKLVNMFVIFLYLIDQYTMQNFPRDLWWQLLMKYNEFIRFLLKSIFWMSYISNKECHIYRCNNSQLFNINFFVLRDLVIKFQGLSELFCSVTAHMCLSTMETLNNLW